MPGKCASRLAGTDPPRYCLQPPQASGTCRFHGANAAKGAANGNFKHGHRSKYLKLLPESMTQAVAAAAQDRRRMSLQDELDLLTAKILHVVEGVGQGSAAPWAEAARLLAQFKAAQGAGDVLRMRMLLGALEGVLQSGARAAESEAARWQEIRELVQEKAKVAAVEWRHLVEMKAVVSVEEALGFVRMLLTAAEEEIQDKALFRRVNDRLLTYVPRPE